MGTEPVTTTESTAAQLKAKGEKETAVKEPVTSSATSETTAEPKNDTPTTPPTSPLTQLFSELPSIIATAEHSEIWGITLADISHIPSSIVLEKFLRANGKDVGKAKDQLIKALQWRKTMEPGRLLDEVEYDSKKFGDLGYVTSYKRADGKGKEIVTWNIYGAVSDIKETFGDVSEFIKWRTALMELSVRELNLPSATVQIPNDGPDPYRMIQVHDYLNISFLRMDPNIRAASKETIETFSMAYPELLKEKFFVNVPLIMGWVFAAMKLFLSAETVKKFHPLSYGRSLAAEIGSVAEQLPEVYGGKGKDVKVDGLTVKYAVASTAE